MLVRPTAPPMWLGLLVAAAAICAETLLVVVLRSLAPMDTFGVVYLLGAVTGGSLFALLRRSYAGSRRSVG